MKKIIPAILSLCLIFCTSARAFATENVENSDNVQTSAESYVLYCADDCKVIASKNENKKMKPASTTKLMTSLLALEEAASSDKTVTFTREMVAEGSSMYLGVGEKVHISDLAVGMMMSSGNDAANATALSLCNSYDEFANLMNERASQIGMKNTHFVTPSGLDDDNHYSTAYDMALLMSYALENEDFAKLTSKKSETVDFAEPEKHITYSNHNRLLSLYEYCIGGKTGYTQAAGRCLVTAAKKDGLTLVCVTMNDRNDWNDHIALYEYGFEHFTCESYNDSEFFAKVPCVGSEKSTVSVACEKDTQIVLSSEEPDKIKRRVYIDSFLYAPIQKNDVVGTIEYSVDGKTVKTVDVLAAEDAERQEDNSILKKIKELFSNG